MDSSTARCPQCGAAIRPSARFCVTCGIKLPENTPASGSGPSASGWTAREEPISQDPDPVWAMPAPQSDSPEDPDTADAGVAATGANPIQESDAASAQPPEPVSWLNWPDSSAELDSPAEPHDEPDIQGEIVELSVPSPGDASAPLDGGLTSDADVGETTGPSVDAVIAEADVVEVAAFEAFDPEAIAMQSTEAELPLPGVAPETVSGNASPLDEAAFEELNPFDDFAAVTWEPVAEPEEATAPHAIEIDLLDDESGNDEPGEMVGEKTELAIDPPASGSLDRANALIDELRLLLPALAVPVSTPEEPRDLAVIRDRALAARGEISFDRYLALREVVQEALTRPRDVEVVLRLSRRVEDMDALIAEWDRLQQAFDQLIAEME